MDLPGRVAVVTGAASGIGRATALALADRGCHLALVDVSQDGLEAVCGLIEARGVTCSIHRVDVADRGEMEALPEAVLATHGAVHIVINNAGVTAVAPLASTSLEDLDWVVGVNLWGVLHGCRFFLPHLLAADEGHLVNVSSTFGLSGLPYQSVYCTTKYAVRGLTESLWEELADTHVGVTLVHPASFDTAIAHGSRGLGEDAQAKLIAVQGRGHPPAMAAARIVRAIERGDKRLMLGPTSRIIDWIKRLFPVFGNRLIAGAALRAVGLSADQLD